MSGKPSSILVVEDEGITRDIVVRYFEQAGHQVLLAASGEEALAILDREGSAIDWLLADINLPGAIDGWTVGEAFHRRDPRRPVVYMSAFAPRRQAHPAGGVYVPKPFSPAMVVDLFCRLAAPDARVSARVRSFLGARVVFNNRFPAVDCLVRDISAGGARLAFSGTDLVPHEFELQIPQKGLSYRARIVWRRGLTCGVQFLEEVKEATRPAS